MNHLGPVMITGIAIFGASTALAIIAFIFFVYRRRRVSQKYTGDKWEVKWSKSQWIYGMTFFASYLFFILYLLQYYSQGFAIKPNLLIIVWMRWLFYAVVGGVYMGVLNYVMTSSPYGAQSLFSLLTYIFSTLAILPATCAISEETRLIWIIGVSMVFFAIAIALLVWPRDKIWTEDWRRVNDIIHSETPTWRIMFGFVPETHHHNAVTIWAFAYRFVLMLNICISYGGLLITWFLSDGNEFSEVSDLRSTLISYLVFDIVFVIPFGLLFFYLTLVGMTKKLSAKSKDASSPHKIIESQPPLYQIGARVSGKK